MWDSTLCNLHWWPCHCMVALTHILTAQLLAKLHCGGQWCPVVVAGGQWPVVASGQWWPVVANAWPVVAGAVVVVVRLTELKDSY